tara:strand:- start:71 stop:754 length:684 start_codon:yes stop_codon:yes gene_type:complete
MKIIVYGEEGWIGKQFCDIIKNDTNHTLIPCVHGSLPDNELDFTHIFSFIGEIGVPTNGMHITYIGDTSKLTKIISPNVLYLNMRIPINGIQDTNNPITKIIKQGVAYIAHLSISVLPELLPLSVTLAEMKVCGIINMVNPDTISHAEILDLYKDIVDTEYRPIKVANQKQTISDDGGNGELSLYFPYIPTVKDSIKRLFIGYKKHTTVDFGFISKTVINNTMTTNI